MFDPQNRNQFLNFAGMFEGGLALIAIGLGWVVGINPVKDLYADWWGMVCGILGAVPLFAFFVVVYRWPIGPFREMREFLHRELAPSLAQLTWYDLILMALLAGVSEELLFRGLLSPWITVFWSCVLFGLAHWVTPTYGVLTFLVGYYFQWLLTVANTQSPNLLTPIVTHAVYDYLAFLVVVRIFRRDQPEGSPLLHTGEQDGRP